MVGEWKGSGGIEGLKALREKGSDGFGIFGTFFGGDGDERFGDAAGGGLRRGWGLMDQPGSGRCMWWRRR